MNKVSRRLTVFVLILSVIGAGFMAFLYFFPYQRVNYTRIASVRTDYRLPNDEVMILDNYGDYDTFITKTDKVFPQYQEDYFQSKVLIVSIREGILYSQSKIGKIKVADSTITVTYYYENDMVVNGEDDIGDEKIYFVDLIEYRKSAFDLTKSYRINFIDEVM